MMMASSEWVVALEDRISRERSNILPFYLASVTSVSCWLDMFTRKWTTWDEAWHTMSCVISKCVTCRRLRGSFQPQKMAYLPVDRLQPTPPFSFCAVDLFGPFLIKEIEKKWDQTLWCSFYMYGLRELSILSRQTRWLLASLLMPWVVFLVGVAQWDR